MPKVCHLRLLSCLALAICAAGCRRDDPPRSPNRFQVYCVNGKVQIDERPLIKMQAMRGSNVVQLEGELTLADAERCAAERGGVGMKCSDNKCMVLTPQRR